MKARHSITQIASLIGRRKSTISRELRPNAGSRGYRPKQSCELATERAEQSRNAYTVALWVKEQASALLRLHWSLEQVASRLPVGRETLYQHVCADKTQGGGALVKNLRCQKQKRKRYASGRDRRGQIPNRRPLSEGPAHIEGRRQVGHWKCDTVIDANHRQAIVTVVERKSGYAVMAKVANKTADLVSQAIIKALTPFETRVKTLAHDNGKELRGHALIDEALKSTGYFAKPFASWERGSNENFNGLLRQYVPKKRPMDEKHERRGN
jgi:IS30 family transposase